MTLKIQKTISYIISFYNDYIVFCYIIVYFNYNSLIGKTNNNNVNIGSNPICSSIRSETPIVDTADNCIMVS